MKYTIDGFSQKKLIEYKLGLEHAIILRWFVDFQASGKMKCIVVNDIPYYWINYNGIIEALPILNLKKDAVYRKFKDLTDCKILKHYTHKVGGVYSYYTLGDNYITLIDDSYDLKPVPLPDLKPEGSDLKPVPLPDLKPEQINSSIKINSSITILFDFIKETTGSRIQLNDKNKKLIKKILDTKYTIDEIKSGYLNFINDKFVKDTKQQLKLTYFLRDIEKFIFAEQVAKKENKKELDRWLDVFDEFKLDPFPDNVCVALEDWIKIHPDYDDVEIKAILKNINIWCKQKFNVAEAINMSMPYKTIMKPKF